jgi:hypothetical protein
MLPAFHQPGTIPQPREIEFSFRPSFAHHSWSTIVIILFSVAIVVYFYTSFVLGCQVRLAQRAAAGDAVIPG